MERNPSFLSKKFNSPQELSKSPEVLAIKQRSKAKGKEVSNKPDALVQDYLDYLKESLDPNNSKREEKLARFKSVLHHKYVIKPDEIPESYFAMQQRVARELGHGDIEINEQKRNELVNVIIADQKSSLDRWIDYLASPDAMYPDWLKYWAMRSVLTMGKLEKYEDEKGKVHAKYIKRTADTVAPFPTLNAAALAETFGAMKEKMARQGKQNGEQVDLSNRSKTISDEAFQKILLTENFSKIYAQFLMEIPEYTTEGLQEIRGTWVVYPQGRDPKPLVDSLVGHPLEWCTKDYGTVQTQLEKGDFYVYYSFKDLATKKIRVLPKYWQPERLGLMLLLF